MKRKFNVGICCKEWKFSRKTIFTIEKKIAKDRQPNKSLLLQNMQHVGRRFLLLSATFTFCLLIGYNLSVSLALYVMPIYTAG